MQKICCPRCDSEEIVAEWDVVVRHRNSSRVRLTEHGITHSEERSIVALPIYTYSGYNEMPPPIEKCILTCSECKATSREQGDWKDPSRENNFFERKYFVSESLTIRSLIKRYLTRKGMDDTDAEKVILLLPETLQKDLDKKEVPKSFMMIATIAVKKTAVEYIDAFTPQAWYRPLFC